MLSNYIVKLALVVLNTFTIFIMATIIYIRRWHDDIDVVIIGMYLLNYILLYYADYMIIECTIIIYPIFTLVFYKICNILNLKSEDIEQLVSAILKTFIGMLLFFFCTQILGFFVESIPLLFYDAYVSYFLVKFCIIIIVIIFSMITTGFLIITEKHLTDCYKKIEGVNKTKFLITDNFFIFMTFFNKYINERDKLYIFFIIIFFFTIILSIYFFFCIFYIILTRS